MRSAIIKDSSSSVYASEQNNIPKTPTVLAPGEFYQIPKTPSVLALDGYYPAPKASSDPKPSSPDPFAFSLFTPHPLPKTKKKPQKRKKAEKNVPDVKAAKNKKISESKTSYPEATDSVPKMGEYRRTGLGKEDPSKMAELDVKSSIINFHNSTEDLQTKIRAWYTLHKKDIPQIWNFPLSPYTLKDQPRIALNLLFNFKQFHYENFLLRYQSLPL